MSGAGEGPRARAARLAAAARALKRAGRADAPFSLAFFTDRRRAPQPEPLLRALPAGAAVVFRDYDDPRRAATARRYASICRTRGVLFLVAGDDDLAEATCANGAHWPAARLSSRRAASRGILSVSAHHAEELAVARAARADIVWLSPVFPTRSHVGAPSLGAEAFRRLAAGSPVPVLALGGVDASNAAKLAGVNVAGFGAIDAFFRG
jgi:thiamine-phosphate pyrophosphorylase